MLIQAQKKAILIAKAAKSKKAEDIVILDLRKISSICDYFVVCDATSSTRIYAISEAIKEALGEEGIKIRHIEGTPESKWVLLDCGDVIVHMFDKETRNFYSLERLWSDAPLVKFEEKRKYVRSKNKLKTKTRTRTKKHS